MNAQYRFHLGGFTFPNYTDDGTEGTVTEWQYFELHWSKKMLLAGIVTGVGGLLYRKKYMEAALVVSSLYPLHRVATILFPRNGPTYLTHQH